MSLIVETAPEFAPGALCFFGGSMSARAVLNVIVKRESETILVNSVVAQEGALPHMISASGQIAIT